MSKFDYDFCVIGAGSGGVRAARTAAGYGARVCIVEEQALGGTCVNVGCVPKKFFMYASHFHEDFEDARAYGWEVSGGDFNWSTLLENKNKEIGRLNKVYENLLIKSGVTMEWGRAVLSSPNSIKIGDKEISARYILLAVGSQAVFPPIPGVEHAITSNDAFYLKELPKKIVVIGGGYIACEFAGIFNGMGVEVVHMVRGQTLLAGFDHDICRVLAIEMKKKGITQRFGAEPKSIDKSDHGLKVNCQNGESIKTDAVMLATGRRPNIDNIGLINVGVKIGSRNEVVIDAFGKSSVDSIYAIGDVANHFGITPIALHEGMAVASTLFADKPRKFDHQFVPTAVFSQPSVGSVGLTEKQARAQYPNIDIYRSEFRALKHSLSGGDEKSMVKMVVDRDSDRVLGCHMVGPDAGEVMQGFAVALRHGATKTSFNSTVGIHPTLAEEFVTLREAVATEALT
ncbi:MAG: glutathione-disulfide reductase [Myxococcales bacterium]|nr:MAG: glutathione-disulfide reductase [Myxococcales bacterium]